ncbi:nucleotidyltransferase domain-containing protein [bacterium]|nr:nucleotidyltransferase domain-containing protein [bacterium]
MVELSEIIGFSDKLAKKFRPERIILFGSCASSESVPGSDVDMLVVLEFEGSGTEKAVEIIQKLKPDFPVDLIARTPSQITDRLQNGDFFIRNIIEKGRLLYEAAYARMD